MNKSAVMPVVTVIVPVYNGVKHIEKCLESVLKQDYPQERMEIYTVDGGSTDGTRDIIEKLAKHNPRIMLLDNPKKSKPAALNLVISRSTGEYICVCDARSVLAPDYVSKCMEVIQQTGADNVGGAVRTITHGFERGAIFTALKSRLGSSGGCFYNPDYEGYVDTVYLGFFNRHVFDKVGLYDEELIRGQDIELNCRIRKAGGSIYISKKINSYYSGRDSLHSLAKRYFLTGMWNLKKVKRNPDAFALRHWVPFGFVMALILLFALSFLWFPLLYAALGIVALYTLINISVSALLSVKSRLAYFPVLLVIFPLMHFCYGFGTIAGFIRFGIPLRAFCKVISQLPKKFKK